MAGPGSGQASRQVPAALQASFDAALFYTLTLWSPLSLAVANSWAGPLTEEKRDWFVGAVSTLFDAHPDTDAYDVETVMLQVMADEFDVEVQDESGSQVADDIIRLRRRIVEEGDLGAEAEAKARWEKSGGGRAIAARGTFVDGGEREDETDAEEEDDDDEDDSDEEMGDAPALVPARPPRERAAPEVDEDGFTTVAPRRRR